jgi:hypothetical protein
MSLRSLVENEVEAFGVPHRAVDGRTKRDTAFYLGERTILLANGILQLGERLPQPEKRINRLRNRVSHYGERVPKVENRKKQIGDEGFQLGGMFSPMEIRFPEV